MKLGNIVEKIDPTYKNDFSSSQKTLDSEEKYSGKILNEIINFFMFMKY